MPSLSTPSLPRVPIRNMYGRPLYLRFEPEAALLTLMEDQLCELSPRDPADAAQFAFEIEYFGDTLVIYTEVPKRVRVDGADVDL